MIVHRIVKLHILKQKARCWQSAAENNDQDECCLSWEGVAAYMGRAGRGAETQNKIIVVILDLFKIIKYHCHRIILVFVILVFFVIVMEWTLGSAGHLVEAKKS